MFTNFPNLKAIEEYWIGKEVGYGSLWDAYEAGGDYIEKFRSMRVHLLRITLREQPREYPLFNFEAVYKTVKGYFHDLKKSCLTSEEYDTAGPLFIYRVDRSSGVWEFLGELRQLLMLGTSLADEKVMGEKLDNLDKRMDFFRRHFGNAANPRDFEMFMRAKTPRQLERAVQNLIKQGVQKVEVSREPFLGDVKSVEATLIDLKQFSADTEENPS
jgi:hypothetical protein